MRACSFHWCPMDRTEQNIGQCVDVVRSTTDFSPQVAVILGSGLGALADNVDLVASFSYDKLPGFPTTSAAGHRGKLLLGRLGSKNVIVMQGRAHLYEGHSLERVTLPVSLMHRLGAHTLIVSNASGGINPRFKSGEVVLIDSHINLMFRTSPYTRGHPIGSKQRNDLAIDTPSIPLRSNQVYSPNLQDKCISIAARQGFSLKQGTYLATLGPNYETRSEYRFFRKIGADMVGMSTVPEVILATQLGLQVLGFFSHNQCRQPRPIAKDRSQRSSRLGKHSATTPPTPRLPTPHRTLTPKLNTKLNKCHPPIADAGNGYGLSGGRNEGVLPCNWPVSCSCVQAVWLLSVVFCGDRDRNRCAGVSERLPRR